MIRFDVMTLFPDMINAVLGSSIIGRAQKAGQVEINTVQIRDFADNSYNKVDDYPYGGGSGLIMQPKPVFDAYKSICDNASSADGKCGGSDKKPFTVFMSPKGKPFNQSLAKELAQKEHIVLLCGHYEGVDQRVIDEITDMEISIGDFVLTGGEIPAMAVVDAVCRLVPGVLASEESYSDESHFDGLLEYPQYTRPPEFLGRTVPQVLLSGDHKKIDIWRDKQALEVTKKCRPDMFKEYLAKQTGKIGVLGGTFDPIHMGHIAIAKSAIKALKLDKVLLVPNGTPPHKGNGIVAEPQQRLEMAHLASEDIEKIIVSDLEINCGGFCYTIDTLEKLRELMPKADFYYIIGGDNLTYMMEWHRAEELIKGLKIICVSRRGFDIKADAKLVRQMGAEVFCVSMKEIPVSATQIRSDFSANIKYINPRVAEYIKANKLYGVNNEK